MGNSVDHFEESLEDMSLSSVLGVATVKVTVTLKRKRYMAIAVEN